MKTYRHILPVLTALLLALCVVNVPAATFVGNLIQDAEVVGHLLSPVEAGDVPIGTRQELTSARNK